ncbi:MAG: DNA repair protein RadC [Candidatus Methylacidiphilales bacterium]|nr:DNA repair protein RadC [Candidatus Methylacidiphilales bacterium]
MSLIRELPEGEKPRERLWNRGAESLRTAELLAILLNTGLKGTSVLQLAEQMLVQYQTLDRLARADVRELARIKGIGPAKATHIKAAFELAGRFSKSLHTEIPMDRPSLVQACLGDEMRQLDYESLRVLCLNAKLHLKEQKEISRGTVNETTAHPRDVLEVAILNRAYGIVLVHNHPSGDPSPSNADLDFTLRLKEAARTMQVHLVDHIILGKPTAQRAGYYSFKEAGYL